MATTVLGLKTFTASDPVDYNEINDNYTKIDAGVKTAMQGRAAHNLLDNSDFRNPVNQRGKTSYNTTWAYSIDRWYVPGTAGVVVNDGSVSFMAIDQFIGPSVKSGIYTVAICLSDGTVHVGSASFSDTGDVVLIHNSTMDAYLQSSTASNGHPRFRMQTNTDSALTAIWAALYEGSYTADTLPAYQTKGYAAELAECQRYYVHCGEASWMTGLFKVGEGLIVEIPTANNIRIPNPTIIVNSPKVFTTNGWYDITYASCTLTKCWTKLLFNFPEAASQFMSYYGAYIIIGIVGVSADL